MLNTRCEQCVIRSTIGGVIAMNLLLLRLGFTVFNLILVGMVSLPNHALGQIEPHGQGYEADDPEKPGTVSHVPRFRAFVPPFRDLSASFPPPGDQGKQGSCVAWSLGYALRGY